MLRNIAKCIYHVCLCDYGGFFRQSAKDIWQSSKDLNLSKLKFFCLHILYHFSNRTEEEPYSEMKAFPMQRLVLGIGSVLFSGY